MREKFLWSFLLRHMSALLYQYKFSIRQCVCQSPCIPRRNQTVCVTCDNQNCTDNNPEIFLSRMHRGKPIETRTEFSIMLIGIQIDATNIFDLPGQVTSFNRFPRGSFGCKPVAGLTVNASTNSSSACSQSLHRNGYHAHKNKND